MRTWGGVGRHHQGSSSNWGCRTGLHMARDPSDGRRVRRHATREPHRWWVKQNRPGHSYGGELEFMILIPETELNLRAACALINTDRVNGEEVTDRVALLTFIDEWSWTGRRDGDEAELNAVLDLRRRVDAIWDGADDETQTVCRVNALLCDTNAAPWLTRHPEMPAWHLHLTSDGDPLARRMGAEIAMAIADLIRAGELR